MYKHVSEPDREEPMLGWRAFAVASSLLRSRMRKNLLLARHVRWGGQVFRFRLARFRFGPDASTRRFSVTEAALLLVLAYLTSKGLGVIRQLLFNVIFGTGPEAIAYDAAFRLPDTLFNLIAGGAFTHAFIPVFHSYEKEHGERDIWRLTSLLLNVLLVSLTLVICLAEWLTPSFVRLILIPGLPPSEQVLTTTLTRIMLLHPLILGLGTIATAVLNSRRQFLLPALSLACYDLGLIGGLLVTRLAPGVGIYGPTYGLLVSAVCQVIILLPGLHQQGARYSWLWNLRHPGLRQVMSLLIPNVLAVGIASIGTILETTFASYLPDSSSIPALHNASMLYNAPLTFVALAMGQALLPHLTAQANAGRYIRMRQTLLNIVGSCVLISLPATIGLAVFGAPVIALFFQHGAFNAHASTLTAQALFGYTVGLPGQAAEGLLILACYACKDARTPLITGSVMLALRLGLVLLLLQTVPRSAAIIVIPLAGSITATLDAILLGWLVFRRLQRRVQEDRGMLRLARRRAFLRHGRIPVQAATLAEEEGVGGRNA